MTYPAPGGRYTVEFDSGGMPDAVESGPPDSLIGNDVAFNLPAGFPLMQIGISDNSFPSNNTTFSVSVDGQSWGPNSGDQPGDATNVFNTVMLAGDHLMSVVDEYIAANEDTQSAVVFSVSATVLTMTTPATTADSITLGFGTLAEWDGGIYFPAAGLVTEQAIGYRITGAGGPLTTIDDLPGPTAVIPFLDPGTSYDFELIYSHGSTRQSVSFLTASTLGDAKPSNLHAITITTTTITMGWDAPSPPADTYTLRYRLTGSTVWTYISGITATMDLVSALIPGTLYDFQVEGVLDDVESGFTDTVAVRTLAAPVSDPVRSQTLRQYRGQVGLNYRGMALVGDAFAGVIGRMNFDTFTEYGNAMRALIVSPPVHMDRLRVFVSKFEIDVESGVGLSEGQGSDPKWMLDWSKDGGRTWSSQQQWRSMGRLGDYTQRLRWLKLGQSRQWIFRLQSTDPVRRVIIGAYLDVEAGMK